MIPTTRFKDYPVQEALRMIEQSKDFYPIFEDAGKKLEEIKKSKLKVEKDTTRPNDIHINPKIIVDFMKSQEDKMPLHLIIDKYDEWFDELYRLMIVNEPWLHHKKVYEHLVAIYTICYTFQAVHAFAIEGLKDD